MVITNLGLKLGQSDVETKQPDRVQFMTETQGLEVIEVPMTAEMRRRVRRRLSLPDGQEIALALPTGTVLTPGSVIYQTDHKLYIVMAELEEVLVFHPASVFEAARIAHFIGNFHRDIDVSGDAILVLYEPALEIRLQKMGFNLSRERRSFLGRPTSPEAHRL